MTVNLVKLTTRSPYTGVGLVMFRSSSGLWLWFVSVLWNDVEWNVQLIVGYSELVSVVAVLDNRE